MKRDSYELLIFDFDGTLVDTLGDIAFYANGVLEESGFPRASVGQVRRAIGRGVHELLKCLAPAFGEAGREADLESAVDRFKARYNERPVRETSPFPGVQDMLEGPLRSFKKAIVTNKPQDITDRILKELSLEPFFDICIGMNGGFPAKPAPDSVDHVTRSLRASPSKTLFIGDSAVDGETALTAKVDFAWVSYGYDEAGCWPKVRSFSSAWEWGSLSQPIVG